MIINTHRLIFVAFELGNLFIVFQIDFGNRTVSRYGVKKATGQSQFEHFSAKSNFRRLRTGNCGIGRRLL